MGIINMTVKKMAKSPSKQRSTIRQVAERAGVSRMTVSNVMMGRESVVRPETRHRVLEAVRELEYVPVRPMLQNRHTETRVISLAIGLPEEISWAIHLETYQGICEEAKRQGYDLLTLLQPEPQWALGRDDASFLDRRSDGVIFATPVHQEKDETLRMLVENQVPTVVCYRRDVPDGVTWVDPDNAAIARGAMEHLAGLGHRHIVHLTDESEQFDKMERLRGFYRECERLGVRGDVVQCGYTDHTLMPPLEALDTIRKSGATAVWAFNDMLALDLWDAARIEGCAVPAELSIVGVDDTPLARQKGLTSVRFTFAEVGRTAVRAMVARLQGEEASALCQTVPVQLVVRSSTQSPPV